MREAQTEKSNNGREQKFSLEFLNVSKKQEKTLEFFFSLEKGSQKM
jgi:hypothetical protein